jgi:hypothetical protein
VTERISWYRANAEKCLALAQRFHDPKSKRALVAMANAWLAMAEQRARNRETSSADAAPLQLAPDRPNEPGAD